MNGYQAELYHHGIKGQKWGIRRYQNEDGSLTAAGQKRYGEEGTESKKYKRDASISKYKEQRAKKKEQYTGKYKGIGKAVQTRAFNIGYRKSTGQIVAKGILGTMGAATIASMAASAASQKGYNGAARAITSIGTVAAATITATHVTAAVQKGRGKI